MTTTKKPDKKATAAQWAAGGEGHRPQFQAKRAEKEAQAQGESSPKKGGRPKPFGGAETVKVALFLPEEMAAKLKAAAVAKRKTISETVADLLTLL